MVMEEGATAGRAPHHIDALTLTELEVGRLDSLVTTECQARGIPAVEAQGGGRPTLRNLLEDCHIACHVERAGKIPVGDEAPSRQVAIHAKRVSFRVSFEGPVVKNYESRCGEGGIDGRYQRVGRRANEVGSVATGRSEITRIEAERLRTGLSLIASALRVMPGPRGNVPDQADVFAVLRGRRGGQFRIGAHQLRSGQMDLDIGGAGGEHHRFGGLEQAELGQEGSPEDQSIYE